MRYIESLTKLGLSPDQAKIYETLLATTLLPARMISRKSGVGRELTYVVLEQLENMDLAERSTEGKIILFRAKHPRHIKKVLEEKRETALVAEKAYKDIINALVGDFNVTHNKPFIRFYEGTEGLLKTYDYILKYAKTVHVIRSLYDSENPELRALITEQLKKQATKRIRSFVLTPQLAHMSNEKLSHDFERNITRKIIPKEKFTLPSQIIIYNNTVSITSMKKDVMTTIIENEDIAETFRKMFQYMWDTV